MGEPAVFLATEIPAGLGLRDQHPNVVFELSATSMSKASVHRARKMGSPAILDAVKGITSILLQDKGRDQQDAPSMSMSWEWKPARRRC